MSREGRQRNGEGRGVRTRPPLDPERLRELALRYVGRFATTRAKLAQYLERKVRERGWSGDEDPPIERLVARIAELGYVDDAAYALAKAGSLSARGFGQGRVRQALRAAGVAEPDSAAAREAAEAQAVEAALRFARRKRIGPFAAERADPARRQKSLAAMIRAGHGFALSRALVEAEPGAEPSSEQLLHLRS